MSTRLEIKAVTTKGDTLRFKNATDFEHGIHYFKFSMHDGRIHFLMIHAFRSIEVEEY